MTQGEVFTEAIRRWGPGACIEVSMLEPHATGFYFKVGVNGHWLGHSYRSWEEAFADVDIRSERDREAK